MYVLNCDRMLSRQPLHSRKWSRAQSLQRYCSWFFSSVTTWMLAVAMNRRLHLSSTSSQRLDTCHNSMSLLPVFFGCWYSVVWLKWCVGLDERSYSSSIEINIEMGYHFIWINSSAGTLQLYFFLIGRHCPNGKLQKCYIWPVDLSAVEYTTGGLIICSTTFTDIRVVQYHACWLVLCRVHGIRQVCY